MYLSLFIYISLYVYIFIYIYSIFIYIIYAFKSLPTPPKKCKALIRMPHIRLSIAALPWSCQGLGLSKSTKVAGLWKVRCFVVGSKPKINVVLF